MPHDHRDLNRDLDIYASDPLAGSGLPLWLPDGAAIRDELQRLAKDLARADGCQDVYSPVLGKRSLYALRSSREVRLGHVPGYAARRGRGHAPSGELSAPRAHLCVAAALLPRAAGCASTSSVQCSGPSALASSPD